MKKLIAILTIVITTATYSQSNNLESINYLSPSEVIIDSFFSNYLKEFRVHSIYLPKGFDKNKHYPIIYATDGGSVISKLGQDLDSLIEHKVIKPTIFVASYSKNKIADSTTITYSDGSKMYFYFRNFEYADRSSSHKDTALTNLLHKHTDYFSKEFIPYIETMFNQQLSREDRYFYGVSNGAGFGIHLLNKHPELIGTYICLSPFGGDVESKKWDKTVKYPKIYWRHGSEEIFLDGHSNFLQLKYKKMKQIGEFKTYQGGHFNDLWRIEFIEIISNELK